MVMRCLARSCLAVVVLACIALGAEAGRSCPAELQRLQRVIDLVLGVKRADDATTEKMDQLTKLVRADHLELGQALQKRSIATPSLTDVKRLLSPQG